MLWHYLQTLDYDRKACKEQTLKLIWPVDKLWSNNKVLWIRPQVPYSQHSIFFETYESANKLDCFIRQLETFTSDKHSNLFLSYAENKVLWIRPQVVNDSLKQSSVKSSSQLTSAVNIIQQEWFKASSTKQSNPLDVEDYLDAIEEMSKALLDRVVNLVSML